MELPAIIEGMPEDNYHGLYTWQQGWFSAGTAKSLRDCPLRATIPYPDRPSLKFGRATHVAIGDLDLFHRTYYKAPDAPRNTKAGKELHEQAAQAYAGKEAIGFDDWHAIMGMRESVFANPIARRLLEGATDTELSCFWSADGVRCKSRIDKLSGLTIVDLKTTISVKYRAFRLQANALGYDLTAAHYLSAPFGFHRYIFIAVEKTEPYVCRVFEYSPGDIAAAQEELAGLRETFKRCHEANRWPGYEDEIATLTRWQSGHSEELEEVAA